VGEIREGASGAGGRRRKRAAAADVADLEHEDEHEALETRETEPAIAAEPIAGGPHAEAQSPVRRAPEDTLLASIHELD
jgi:hypothetical protein